MEKKNKQKFKTQYISLKEAARISGYSSDYIGQLIREGKIWGKPVYTNIAWRTTAEEVLKYKQEKKNGSEKDDPELKNSFKIWSTKIRHLVSREIKVLKLFAETFRFAIPLIIILIISFSLLIGYLFSRGSNQFFPEKSQALETNKENEQILKY